MIHHYFEVHSLHEEFCIHTQTTALVKAKTHVHAYLLWRVLSGQNKKITLSFMHVGHTHCMVDGNFALIKKAYCCSDVDTVAQLSNILSHSSATNIPQLYSWE